MKEKLPILIIVAIALVGAIGALIWFSQIKRFDAENTTITYVESKQDNQQVEITFTQGQAGLSVNRGDSITTLGLTTDQQDKIIDLVNKTTKLGEAPARDEACDDNLPEADSWLEISDNENSGITYFCSGIGVDENGNLKGPVQDILREINVIEDNFKPTDTQPQQG
ncbi:hypothetical protein KBC31_02035 [Candidatus Saccharibacteria bacterium]|jgi:hypothetical protein|nr:hypothetical protein [Candidatus Saccharibacteria bacterium]